MTSKFERKFGKYAVQNLPLYLILGYVIGYIIQIINPEMYEYLSFDPFMICRGQVWRIITWILSPPMELGIFTIIMLILYYQLGRGLESVWGTYRFNVYIFSGMIFTMIGAMLLYLILYLMIHAGILFPADMAWMVSGNNQDMLYRSLGAIIGNCVSTYYINMSIFLAYAITYPQERLLLYFLIPVRMKWFGILYGVLILVNVYDAFRANTLYGIIILVLVFASLLNFILYMLKRKNLGKQQKKRRQEYRQSIRRAAPVMRENGARHKCVVCGRTELDDPNLTFRYCSKCSGNKEYCQDHLFTHEHK